MLQKVHGLETGPFQRAVVDAQEFKTGFSKATRRYRHMFTPMENVDTYVCGLKPSICKEILKELRRMSPNVSFNLNDIERITAENERSQRALMEHAQPLQPTNTRTRKKDFFHF